MKDKIYVYHVVSLGRKFEKRLVFDGLVKDRAMHVH